MATQTEPMTEAERFEAALQSRDPGGALRTVVLELASEGIAKPEVYARLEKFLLDRRQREEHSESDEDALQDVLDALVVWCHPETHLL